MVTVFFKPLTLKLLIDDKSLDLSEVEAGGGGGIEDDGGGGGGGGPGGAAPNAGGGGGGGGGGGARRPELNMGPLGVIGVLGVAKGDGESGIDIVSQDDNIESDLIELESEPFARLDALVFIFKELLNA